MNKIFLALGIESWKPLVSAIFVSPLPLIVLVLIGASLAVKRRGLAWALILLGCGGLWLSSTHAAGERLTRSLSQPQAALDAAEIARLRNARDAAIVVLGAGRRAFAPEYGAASLTSTTSERLRYAIWLARATGLPIAFSGGIGWSATPGLTESETAARVADREFGFTLRWQEDKSRDTRENAVNTIALLAPLGIRQIVLVTNGSDMRRALANFARAGNGMDLRIIPAPMDLPTDEPARLLDWLPSPGGYEQVWGTLHEWVGLLAGA